MNPSFVFRPIGVIVLGLVGMATMVACAAPATLTPNVPSPFALGGTSWQLRGLNTRGTPVPLVTKKTLTVQFGVDGTVHGDSGCNTFAGAYNTMGEILTISALTATERACVEPEAMAQEAVYLDALSKAQLYEQRGDELSITFNNGQGKLVFARAP